MPYRDGIKIKGWEPRGGKMKKKLSSLDSPRDAYWTSIADDFLNHKPTKKDVDKLDKELGI